MRLFVFLLVFVAACSGASTSGTVELPEDIRAQMHEATGHEPGGDCVDLRTGQAEMQITPDGFRPHCVIVAAAQDLIVRNSQDIDDTLIVSDPPTEAEIPRHARGVYEVAAGESTTITGIGGRVGTGVWPCYGRESRHECELVVLP